MEQLAKKIVESVDLKSYITETTGVVFKKYGSSHMCVCPLHGDVNPSLAVKQDKLDAWYCFGCGKGGTVIQFEANRANVTRKQAVINLAKHAGIDDYEQYVNDDAVMSLAQQYFTNRSSQARRDAFFADKKVDILTVEEHGVGCCDNVDNLTTYLVGAGVAPADIVRYGFDSDYFTNCVTYPVKDSWGRISYFLLRKLDGDVKYVNANSSSPTYDEGLMYGIHAISNNFDKPIALVEGPNDVLALLGCGVNVVAMRGLKLPQESVRFLRKEGFTKLVLWVDGDLAGLKFALGQAERYGEFEREGVSVYVKYLHGLDPDDAPDSTLDGLPLLPIWYLDNKHGKIGGDYNKTHEASLDVAVTFRDCGHFVRELVLRRFAELSGFDYDIIHDFIVEHESHYSYETEMMACAIVYNDNQALYQYSVQPEWFVTKRARLFVGSMLGQAVDFNSTKMSTFIDSLPDLLDDNYERVFKTLHDLHSVRVLKGIATRVGEADSFEDVVSRLSGAVLSLTSTRLNGSCDAVDAATSLVQDIVEQKLEEGVMDLGSRWPVSQATLMGVRPGKLIFIAGFTGHGKSYLALNWADRLSFELGNAGLYISGEMDEREIMGRILAMRTGVPAVDITSGKVESTDTARLLAALPAFTKNKFFINQTTDFQNVLNITKFMKAKHDIKYVVIDYVQLLAPPKSFADLPRYAQYKEMSRRLKTEICKGLGIPVIAVAQLGDNDDKIPTGRRLSESKLMMADADVLVALKRKTDKEIEVDSAAGDLGNIILHYDKMRYNKSGVIVSVRYNDTTGQMTEVQR